jgi:hypothetical protein
MKAAEKWEAVGKKSKGVEQERFYGRAVEWYQNALNSTTNPIAKVKIEKKLKEFEGKTGTQNGLVNLLTLIDPQKDAVAGKWRIENSELISDSSEYARIKIPYSPPEEYDLEFKFNRSGNDSTAIILSKPNTANFVFGLGWWGKFAGFGLVKGKDIHENSTASEVKLASNNAHACRIEVRDKSVKAYLNGKLITEYTNYQDLQCIPGWVLPDKDVLGIGSSRTPTKFYQISIKEIRGKGKNLRK